MKDVLLEKKNNWNNGTNEILRMGFNTHELEVGDYSAFLTGVGDSSFLWFLLVVFIQNI